MKKKNSTLTINIAGLRSKDKTNLIQLLFVEAGVQGKTTSDVVKKLSALDPQVLALLVVQMYEENQTARELLKTQEPIINPGGRQF